MNAQAVRSVLDGTMPVDGAVGAVPLCCKGGMCRGTSGGQGLNPEVAAAGNAEVAEAKMKTITALGLRGSTGDVLITQGSRSHLVRIVKGDSALFSHFALNKANPDLPMARYLLSAAGRMLA